VGPGSVVGGEVMGIGTTMAARIHVDDGFGETGHAVNEPMMNGFGDVVGLSERQIPIERDPDFCVKFVPHPPN
jgi:hypothetical protein